MSQNEVTECKMSIFLSVNLCFKHVHTLEWSLCVTYFTYIQYMFIFSPFDFYIRNYFTHLFEGIVKPKWKITQFWTV